MSEVSDYDYDDDYNYEVYDREDPWVDPRDNQSIEDNIYDRVINKFTHEFNTMKKLLEDERALRIAQITKLQVQLTQVQSENIKLLQTIDILESKSRKNNVIIFGVDEQENGESPVTTVENICQTLDVDINQGTISDAYRVGRNKGKRPIVCTVSSFRKKTEIMQKNKSNGQFAILHDLTKKERREKKELKKHLDDARSRGHRAYIRHGNLIINGLTFTREELLGNAAVPLPEDKKGELRSSQRENHGENTATLLPPKNPESPDNAPIQMAVPVPDISADNKSAPLAVSVTSRKTVTPLTPEKTPTRRASPSKLPIPAGGGKRVITASPPAATKNQESAPNPPLSIRFRLKRCLK